MLRSHAATAEQVNFPCVEQIALLRRHLRKHSPETVALVTSLAPQSLNAAQWLQYNRAAWGIESGLHQRLDISHLAHLPPSGRVFPGERIWHNSLAGAALTRVAQPPFVRFC